VSDLRDSVDRVATETGFSGVVRVDRGGDVQFAAAYGLAHRGCRTANTVDTQFAIASGTKGLTALTVVSLIEEGRLELAATARSLLADDLPLIGDEVTVEQLLAHRSRATGTPFHELVQQRVCGPAGMRDTGFLRSDELPGRAAVGYLASDGLRSNVLHLPVRGSGDGGIYSTAADVHAMWAALFAGRIVSPDRVVEMVAPRSDVPSESMRYGLGFWLHESGDAVMLEGSDAGVSFRTVHDPAGRYTHTVLSNTTAGAWPVTLHLDELLTH
jgi:CubicO group peptidase (beta-lactamase class C family)